MASRLRRRTSDQTVLSSNPAVASCVESLDKALYSHCPQGEAFTLASISYLAILVKYILAKKKKKKNDRSVDCKKTDSVGAWSPTSPASASLRLFLHCELFFMRRNGLSILKACSYIFYLKWVFGSHVT